MDWLKDLTGEGWAALIALVALFWSVGGSALRAGRGAFARVSVDLVQSEGAGAGDYEFIVSNQGRASARDVDLKFGLIPEVDAQPIFIASGRMPLPIPKLEGGRTVYVRTKLVLAVPSAFEVEVHWRDRWRRKRVVTVFR